MAAARSTWTRQASALRFPHFRRRRSLRSRFRGLAAHTWPRYRGQTLKQSAWFLALTLALLCTAAFALPFPAVEILQGPPAGNYCNAARVSVLIDVNTRPGEQYFGQGTFKVNGQIVFVSAITGFSFPAGVQTAQFPLPLEVLPGGTYPPGTVFATVSRYFDSSRRATYENEIAIRCDTGQTILIRNSDLTLTSIPVPIDGMVPALMLLIGAAGIVVCSAQMRSRPDPSYVSGNSSSAPAHRPRHPG